MAFDSLSYMYKILLLLVSQAIWTVGSDHMQTFDSNALDVGRVGVIQRSIVTWCCRIAIMSSTHSNLTTAMKWSLGRGCHEMMRIHVYVRLKIVPKAHDAHYSSNYVSTARTISAASIAVDTAGN
jgi:hypothetical protein